MYQSQTIAVGTLLHRSKVNDNRTNGHLCWIKKKSDGKYFFTADADNPYAGYSTFHERFDENFKVVEYNELNEEEREKLSRYHPEYKEEEVVA